MHLILNKQVAILTIITSIFFSLQSCKDNHVRKKDDKTDLMKYGVPYSIKAPEDVKITKIGQGDLTDVSINNNKGYDLQIFMGSAQSSDINKIKENKRIIFTSNPFFSKIIEEYDDGYLFEKTNQEGDKSYDFIIIKVIGTNEINFQCGNSREFNEKEVKDIVKSIRS